MSGDAMDAMYDRSLSSFREMLDALLELSEQMVREAVPDMDEDAVAGEWTDPERDFATKILGHTFGLLSKLEQDGCERASVYSSDLISSLEEYLQHRRPEFAVADGVLIAPEWHLNDHFVAHQYDQFANELVRNLRNLAREFPDAVLAAPLLGSVWAEREYVARRIGRSLSGLEDYVSNFKAQYREDLPWVIRKENLKWHPNIELFEEWYKTPEGAKARKKRGRKKRK